MTVATGGTLLPSPGELAAGDGIPFEIAAAARSYADALLADGDLDAAAVEVGRASRWSDQDFG